MGMFRIKPLKVGKKQNKMDETLSLIYARFRKDDEGGFMGRTKRQQQVMQAIMKQVKKSY